MKKYSIFILLAALSFLGGGCSSSDSNSDFEPTPEPQPETPDFLRSGNDTTPNWMFTDGGRFELRMSLQVELGDTLATFQSSDDLMSASINGEVRAVATPNQTGGQTYYPLVIFDHEMGNTVSLNYYCSKLQRIYTISNWAVFDPSAAPTGNGGIYRPRFTTAK